MGFVTEWVRRMRQEISLKADRAATDEALHETYLSYLQRFKEHRRAARREEKEIDT